MAEQYFSVNIRMLLDQNSPSYIGENGVQDILSDFSCPNEDVAHFLHHNAIEFTKKINPSHIWFLMRKQRL